MKLVFYLTPERLEQIEETENPVILNDLEGLRGGLPEYGATWAKMFPTDIVMLVEDKPPCANTWCKVHGYCEALNPECDYTPTTD